MAKLKAVFIMLIVTVLASACGIGGAGPVAPSTLPQQEEQTKKQTDEIYIGRNKVPIEVAKWAEDNKLQAKVSKKTIGSLDVYLISLGEKSTSGYQVKIDQAGFDMGVRWIIDLSITQPIPGGMAAQVITYPYEVLAVPSGTPVKLRLWNQKGEYEELVDGQDLNLLEPEFGSVSRTVRPDGEYFLYPGPEPVFLALPQDLLLILRFVHTKPRDLI
ncbi:MAG: hypothetical protein JM58_15030 [Peptococcaceae bacterium BICA1-8]|nr:MAG: hypothetical protein JM58_15030 [Peptococcaceae bacterium BICA1-8]